MSKWLLSAGTFGLTYLALLVNLFKEVAMVIMKWQRNRRGIGKIGALCLVLALVVTLIMPASAYAAQPDASPSVSGVEIARKTVFGDSGSKGRKWQGQFAGQQLATITGKLGELPKGKERYAIVIGSNYIGSVPSDGQIPVVPPFFLELGYAEDDAEAIAGLLMAYGFDKVIPLVGDAASRRNILNAIDKIGDLEKDGDEVVFFYSGHGARQYAPGCKDRDRGHRGLGVVHEGIVTDQGDGKTVDFLWDEDLAKAFSKFQTDRIVFIFDSCLAGGMTELARKGRIVCGATTSTGIVAGGIDTSIYKKDVAYYWGVEPLDFYVSAETLFVAMQAWNKKAMTFIANSVFLEFIPYDKKSEYTDIKDSHPRTVLLNELEEGKLYEVILTQFHGMPLLRYRINDLIKVVALKDEEAGIHLPQIMIQRKVGESIGLGGLADIDEKTIWQAIVDSGIKFVDWTARKEIDQNQSFIRLYIELKEQREAVEIATTIDNQLKILDADYRDVGAYLKLQPVKVTLLPAGTFQRYTAEKRREGADLAHLKPVRVNPPEEILQRLLRLGNI